MVFSQEQRAKIVKADPSRKADIGGVAKEIGAAYPALAEEFDIVAQETRAGGGGPRHQAGCRRTGERL